MNLRTRKPTLIKSIRSKYRVYKFNGFGQCVLTRRGGASKGEPPTVEIVVPEFIGYMILTPMG